MIFENFLQDMGLKPTQNHSLDRKDTNGDYTPENCKWSTKLEQDNNRRTNVFYEFQGERMTLSQWARKLNVVVQTLAGRLEAGWSLEKTLTDPVRKTPTQTSISNRTPPSPNTEIQPILL